jgi:hypothetical protein
LPIASSAIASNFTITNGNLDASGTSTNQNPLPASIFNSTGKWYCEFVRTSGSSARFGIINQAGLNEGLGNGSNGWAWLDDGRLFYQSSVTSYGSAISTGDIVMIAFDLDAGKVWYGKNGTWFGSGDPATGASASQSFTANQTMSPAVATGGVCAFTANFGQRAFSYTAPTNYRPIVDTLLPAPVVAKGSSAMDVALFTGNGSSQNVTGLNFAPDFVWAKRRSAADSHLLFDVIRGATVFMGSDTTNGDQTLSSGLTAFNSDGFSWGSYGSGATFVGWAWDAGTNTVTNNSGSISSQVRANASAGLSVVTYTGTGSNATVGHGLGIAPSMTIVKVRNRSGDNWLVYHKSLSTPATDYLLLSATSASGTLSGYWNGGPTSSVIGLGNYSAINNNGDSYVAYNFSPVSGYSSMGSYVGNGSSDGSFVYTGFRPKLLLIKTSTTARDWVLYDTSRSTYNTATARLVPNSSGAEVTSASIDILSNGFKIRSGSGSGFEEINESGATLIYAAWAENPFQYARAR